MTSPTLLAARIGVHRGWTEYVAGLRSAQDAMGYLLTPAIFLVVLILKRDDTVDGTSLPFATVVLPGVVGLLLTYGTMISVAYALSAEREDGTLLRAKAVPNGMIGYLVGQVVRICLEALTVLSVIIVPGLLLVDGLMGNGIRGWLTLLGVTALGLCACMPIGVVVGSLMNNPRAVGGWGMMVIGGLVFISGIFAPITNLPGWLQVVGQVFPMYWLGLGMRSAFLPDGAVVLEISQSWRQLETVGVLCAWTVLGLLLASVVLRRMARKVSGSTVAERRRKAMQRL